MVVHLGIVFESYASVKIAIRTPLAITQGVETDLKYDDNR